MIDQLLEQLTAANGDLCIKGKYIQPSMYADGREAVSKFGSFATALSGMNISTAKRFTEALPNMPSEADTLSRLAWLKLCQQVMTMLQNVVKDGIAKMEAESK